MKLCGRCGEDDQEAFSPAQAYVCRPCVKATNRAWKVANPERNLANKRRWCKENAAHEKARQAKYQKDNSEDIAARKRKWGKENKGLVASLSAKRRAKRRAQTPEDANLPLIKALYTRAAWLKENFGVDVHVDHIKPISKGGLHTMENLQLLPAFLNMSKGAKYEQDS